MERSGKREGLLEKTAEVFDLPGDVLAGLPRVELTGDRELRMENHRGILSYGTEEIHISGGRLVVKSMNARELLLTGAIRAVELE